MTTKPKAKKFRMRSPAAAGTEPAAAPALAEDGAVTTGLTRARNTAPMEAPQPLPPAPEGATDLDAIRKEGLTGRQLRMARRAAQKHGLAPTSDFDAVRQLREKGIDPFQRNNMLELVNPQKPPAPTGTAQLPQTIDTKKQALTTELANPAERRAAEIQRIQHELASRRRKKMALLLTRLAFFVLLPGIIAGYYFYVVATPMYATKSEFLIIKAESGGGGGVGGLLQGTQFATNQDAIAVQSYLQSKDAMLRLDADVGFKSHFTQDWIDPIQRLSDTPTNEEAYKLYKRNIEISYDPTEGVIRMEIMAATPEVSAQYSEALIGYAEERVDNLSLRKRASAVEDAEAGLIKADQDRQEAQEKLVRLQIEADIVDPAARIASLRQQISTYEIQLQEKELQLQALLDNPRPNRAKVDGARGDVRRLNALLDKLNAQMTSQTDAAGNSLAERAVQVQLAEADLANRNLMQQAALERLEQARRDADSQARYLTTSVKPVAPEDPSYPRSFENTALAFLIFGGIYLMISLTASILREQVST